MPLAHLANLLLLIHWGFGCCVHHAHSWQISGPAVALKCESPSCCTEQHAEPAVHDDHVAHADGRHVATENAAPTCPAGPCPHQEHCPAPPCELASPALVPYVVLPDAHELPAMIAVDAELLGNRTSPATRCDFRGDQRAVLPLRVHLYLGVLLI